MSCQIAICVSHAKTNKTVKSTGALHFAGLFTAPVRTRCGSSVVDGQ
jgi:hypothetical protein